MPDPVRRDWFPSTLRGLAAGVLILCVLAALVGLLPGYDVYKDGNDCIGRAIGRLVAFEHGDPSACIRADVFVRTDPAGGLELVLAMLPIVLGALLVRRWPGYVSGFLWPVAMVVTFAVWFVATFSLDLFSGTRTVMLWPAHVVAILVGAIAVILTVLMFGVPLLALVRAILRPRAPRPEPLARARVVKLP